MNTSHTDSIPDEDDAIVTATGPGRIVPQQLTDAQQKALNHMSRLQRSNKPCILTLYWNGRTWAFWEGKQAGMVLG